MPGDRSAWIGEVAIPEAVKNNIREILRKAGYTEDLSCWEDEVRTEIPGVGEAVVSRKTGFFHDLEEVVSIYKAQMAIRSSRSSAREVRAWSNRTCKLAAKCVSLLDDPAFKELQTELSRENRQPSALIEALGSLHKAQGVDVSQVDRRLNVGFGELSIFRSYLEILHSALLDLKVTGTSGPPKAWRDMLAYDIACLLSKIGIKPSATENGCFEGLLRELFAWLEDKSEASTNVHDLALAAVREFKKENVE